MLALLALAVPEGPGLRVVALAGALVVAALGVALRRRERRARLDAGVERTRQAVARAVEQERARREHKLVIDHLGRALGTAQTDVATLTARVLDLQRELAARPAPAAPPHRRGPAAAVAAGAAAAVAAVAAVVGSAAGAGTREVA